jgi:isopentenyldiphosphate isomerase
MPSEEIITLYLKDAPDAPISCHRTDYYDNDFTTYVGHYPALIDVFLFNVHGDVLLQKRGRNKRNNPGKLHTTIGGHVRWGETVNDAVVQECLEELGAPAFIFSQDQYTQALERLSSYTHKAALLCEAGEYFRNYSDDPIESRRGIKDRVWLYFGRYDGPIEMPDRESAGYEWINLDVLQREFEMHPDQFTDGLKLYVENFGNNMKEFVRRFSVDLTK